MNTEIANNKMEIYTHKLFELTDQFVNEVMEGNEEKLTKHFRELLFYLSDRIERIDNGDIDELNNLFDSYVRLCCRYDKLPTLEGFSFLTRIHRSTFDDWKNMRYRSSSTDYADTIKRWYDICKSFVVDELSNNKVANVNLIFTAKAAYGMRETSPIPAGEIEQKKVLKATELPRLGEPKEDMGKNAAQSLKSEGMGGNNEVLPYLGDAD